MLEDKHLTRRPKLGPSTQAKFNARAFSDQIPAGRAALSAKRWNRAGNAFGPSRLSLYQ